MAEWTYILRVLLAAGLSAAIGIEREFHGRPAGLRTHLLVGVGAALVIVSFQLAWGAFAGGEPSANGLPAEVGRLAAGVITGIGFLGAGTIIKVGDWVRGLTTAASLWFVAALGIASGLGVSWMAIVGGVIGLTILAVVDPLAARIPSPIYQMVTLIVEKGRQRAVQEDFLARCSGRGVRVTLADWKWDSAEGLVTLTFMVRHRGSPDLQALAEHAAAIEGVVETHI